MQKRNIEGFIAHFLSFYNKIEEFP